MEDAKIVELYWQRRENAIDETARKYGSYLLKIAQNILFSREDSRECVNDTYLDAWNSMPPHRPNVLSTYLGKITRRISIDLLRKNTTLKRGGGEYILSLSELSDCIADSSPQQALDRKLLTDAIARYLQSVSQKAREAFICRYFYMDSLRDTARHCHLTEANAKVLLHRTRVGLKDFLKEEGFL